MEEHPIQGLMTTAMESIREMVDVNTVVGEAVETKDGTVIVPVSRVTAGFAAGGAEYEAAHGGAGGGESKLPFGGGSGAGVTVQPVGFLVVASDSIRFLAVDDRAVMDRVLDVAPEVLEHITSLFRGNGTVVDGRPREPMREAQGIRESTTVRAHVEPEL